MIYYSIFLIIYSLTDKYYSKIFDSNLSSYFGIILSIILLVYSIINSNAKYSERIKAAEQVLNSVKNIKRELDDCRLNDQKQKYDSIMQNAEYREDIDFFRTLKQKCKEVDIKWYKKKNWEKGNSEKQKEELFRQLNNYLSEIDSWKQQGKIVVEILYQLLIFVVPIAIFLICFLVKS